MLQRKAATVGPTLAVVATAGVVMLCALGGPRLWDRDEPRNAGCAAEMLHRGDWVTPVFNGELRSHKPVLLYWLMMGAYAVLGVNEFAARLPSALLAIGTCWLTCAMATRMFDRRTGMWSGIVLCSAIMFAVAGRAATPDSLLIFLTTAATAVYVGGAFPARPESGSFVSWRRALAIYGLMGLAMLAKGPVGLVLPTAVIGMFLLLERLPTRRGGGSGVAADDGSERKVRSDQRGLLADLWRGAGRIVASFAPGHFLKTCWHMRPLTAIVVALAVAAPWYVWVGLRTDGAWLEGFFLEHNWGRAVRRMEGHGGLLVYYPLALFIGFFPWSVFAAPTVAAVWRLPSEHKDRRAVLFCCCWVGVYVGLFTIARTKLPSYVTPCYPALAMLTAWLLRRLETGASRLSVRSVGFAAALLAVLGVAMAAGLPIAAGQLLGGEQWLGLLGLIPLTMAAACWRLRRAPRQDQLVRWAAAGAVALVLAAFGWAAERVSRHQQFDRLLAAIERHAGDAPRIATYECMEPSWAFYAQHKIHRVWLSQLRSPEEQQVEAQLPAWSPDPPRQDLGEFLNQGPAFVITLDYQYERIRDQLPASIEVLAEAQLFLKRAKLLLLYAPPQTAAAPAAGPRLY